MRLCTRRTPYCMQCSSALSTHNSAARHHNNNNNIISLKHLNERRTKYGVRNTFWMVKISFSFEFYFSVWIYSFFYRKILNSDDDRFCSTQRTCSRTLNLETETDTECMYLFSLGDFCLHKIQFLFFSFSVLFSLALARSLPLSPLSNGRHHKIHDILNEQHLYICV